MPLIQLFDGSRYRLPEGTSDEEIDRFIYQKTREIKGIKPESGGVAAFKSGIQSLIGAGAALAGRAGLMDVDAAQREYEARKQRAEEIFQPSPEGWGAPINKILELAGSSAPYMALPVAAGAATLAAPVTGAAATALGLGAAGLTSAAQFTGSDLVRQMETGKGLRETELGSAVGAAIFQALLDTAAMRMIPGVGRIFGSAGVKVTKENAEAIAKQALSTTLKDYAVSTGRAMTTEGITEAAQQSLERLQAGLSISDPAARDEYLESFIGGAVLGGVLSPAGRYVERSGEQREARGILKAEADRVAKEQRDAEEARKQTPEYLRQLDADYQAAIKEKERLEVLKGTKPGKGAPEDVLFQYNDNKKAFEEHIKNVLRPLAQEYNARRNDIAKVKQQDRLSALTPQQAFLESLGLSPEEATLQTAPSEKATQPTYEDLVSGTLGATPAAPTVAPELQYAAQQVALANERELADQRETRNAKVDTYLPYLMQDTAAAYALVKNKADIPNVPPAVSISLKSKLEKALEQLGKDIGTESAARAAQQKAIEERVGAEREGLARIAEGSEAAREYFERTRKERIENTAEDARLAAESQRMAAPIQEQRNLFGPEGEVPEATSLTRTYVPSEGEAPDRAAITELVKQGKFDEARAALTKIETAPASDADKKALNNALTLVADKPLNPADRALVEQIQDNFDSFTKNAKATRDAVDYFYKDVLAREGAAPAAPEAREQSTRNIQSQLAQIEAGKRSETEQQTQLARRRLTPEERTSLLGTTLGPRGETGVVEETGQGPLNTKIANFAQQAKIGTPIREATDEIARAVQTELPFTDRRDEPIARSSVSFNNWRDFQDYLSGSALQTLRSANEEVTNRQYPNIHRANVIAQDLLKKADGIRQQALAIAKQRTDIMGTAEVDAATANKIRQEAYAALEKALASVSPLQLPKLVESISRANANLDAAQKAREQLLVQVRDNVAKFSARVGAYEEATGLTTAPTSEADETPIAVTGQEARQARAKAAARQDTLEARNSLAEAIDDLISLQRWQANAQRSVNFIDASTSKTEQAARRQALTRLTKDVNEQRALVAKLYSGLVSGVSSLSGKVKAPTLPDKVFKDFLIEEAKLTDLVNQQTRRIDVGLRLAVNNARLRLNSAYTALENEPQTAALRQKLRQQIVQAEALDNEMRSILTSRRAVANSAELVAAQQALTQKANEVKRKADLIKAGAAKRAAQRLPSSKIVTETQADREARDAEKRKEEQARLERAEEPVAGPATKPGGIYAEKPLEERQKEGEPIPRTQVLMEVRRKLRQRIEDKVDQLSELRKIAEDPESTLDERVEATNAFAKIYKDTKGGLEKLDAKITNAFNTQKALLKKISDLREQLAQDSVLSENQKTRYKNKPEVLAEKEQATRRAINNQISKLFQQLSKATAYLSANRGIERVRVPTKAEQAEARTAPREVEDILTPTGERIAQTQTTGRQVGPVVKKGTVAPEQLRTGTEESRAGDTKTSTRNKLRESNARNVPVGVDKDVTKTAESLIKQLVPLQTELNDVNRRLNFISDNPTNTEKQKAAKAELEQRKKDVTAQMTALRKQLAEISKGEKQVSAEVEKAAVEQEKKLTAEEAAGVFNRKSGPVLQSRGPTTEPSTVASLRAELGTIFPDLGRVQTYESVEALIEANPQYEGRIPSDARGFVDTAGNKAFLIAENIDKGHALSVLLHEVGAHIGLKNMLGDAQYNALVNAVKSWEKRTDNSTEAKVARAARSKVEAAETKAGQVNDELLAYAVEEAVNAGVKPTETKGVLGRWLSQIAALFRKALEKFGLPPKALDAQGLVDMAFGAAKMEMRGELKQAPGKGELMFTYAGEKSGVAPDALLKAKDMQIKGAEPEKIWSETGWFQAPDKKWRYEIDDSKAKFNIVDLIQKHNIIKDTEYKTTLDEVMQHPELYKLYPSLKDIEVTLYSKPNSSTLGSFNHTKKALKINVGKASDFENTILHEVQHYIQGEESFTSGSSPDAQYLKAYTKKVLESVRETYVRKAKEDPDTESYYLDRVKAIDAGINAAEEARKTYVTNVWNARKTWHKEQKDADAKLNALETEYKEKEKAARAAFDAYMNALKEGKEYAALKEAHKKARVDAGEFSTYLNERQKVYDALAKARQVFLDVKNGTKNNLKDVTEKALKDALPANNSFAKFAGLYISEAAYQNVLGEVEARDVAERQKLTPEERATTRPYTSQPQTESEFLFSRKTPKYAAGLEDASKAASKLFAPQKTFREKLAAALFGFRAQFIDAYDSTEETFRRAGTDPLKATQAMYLLRMYNQRTHFTSQAVFNGAPELRKLVRKDGKEERLIQAKPGANVAKVVEILKRKDVVQAAGSADAADQMYSLYRIAKRAENVGYDKLNFKDPVAVRESVRAAMAQIEANPTLSKAFKEADAIYNQYNRDLLNFLVETGAIGKELAERLVKNDDYVPYYRVRDGVVNLMIGGETPIRIGNLKDSPHLQELVGGDEPVVSFLEGAVQNTSMLVDMAMRNIAMKNLMMELREAGLAKVYPVKKSSPPKGAVTFKIKGVEHYAIVDTKSLGIDSELLVKGLEGIPTMFPAFVRIMGIPSRILRRLIVASPVYMARQLLRDSTTAALASGANIIPVVDALKQIGKENVLEARGITGGQTFTGMPEDITRILKDMQSGKLSLTAGLAWLETQSAKADALTRKAQYDSYIKQGMSEMEATMAALESMNFSRRGLSPTIHMLNTLIPFFNSQIQGLDVLYRAFTGKMPMNEKLEIRRKLIQRGLLLAGMSFAYALAMQDDEAYKNAKPEEKYGNWFVHIPGFDQPVRIPIPFELGYIFKALPEALVNILSKEEGGEEALKALGHIVQQTIPGMSSYFMPQGVKPAIETVLNTSFYTKRGIESGRELELEPGERYRDGTSALAKEVGSFVGFSPIKLEYLIRGYTGGMGMALVQALSLPFSREGAQPAEKRWSDLPVIGTAFQPTDASGIIDATYDAMKEVSQKQATYKRMLEEGRNEDAQAYLEKNLASIEQASLAGRFRQQMGAITAQENKVKRSPELTPAQKRQRLDELRQAKIELATAVRESGRTARQASLGG